MYERLKTLSFRFQLQKVFNRSISSKRCSAEYIKSKFLSWVTTFAVDEPLSYLRHKERISEVQWNVKGPPTIFYVSLHKVFAIPISKGCTYCTLTVGQIFLRTPLYMEKVWIYILDNKTSIKNIEILKYFIIHSHFIIHSNWAFRNLIIDRVEQNLNSTSTKVGH